MHENVERVCDVAVGLRRRVVETCREVFADARGVALLGFPDDGNVGDSALWPGQLAVLRELGLGRPRYVFGRPHVILDDSHGKISAFHRAWTRASDLVVRCDDAKEGLEVARTLSGGSRSSRSARSA